MKDAYIIKVKFPGDKRSRLLSDGGRVTRLRVHAVHFKEKNTAQEVVNSIKLLNPEVTAVIAKS